MSEHTPKMRPIDPRAVLWRSTLGWAAAGLMGTLGMAALFIPDFPRLAAAQITAGIIGLTGGLSYYLLLGSLGAPVSRRHAIRLLVVWAGSSVLGVTPLFFASGPSPKMLVLTFYSFAVSGALGGAFTVRLLGSLFSDPERSRDWAPPVVIWSFGAGVSAIVSDLVGEALQTVLPAWAAWLFAYEAMALVIGMSGGLAVARYLRPPRVAGAPPKASGGPSLSRCGSRQSITALVLLCLPFYLNDLSDIYIADWHAWLAIDYIGLKLFPLSAVCWLILTGREERSAFGWEARAGRSFGTVFLIAALTGIFIDQNGYQFIGWLRIFPRVGRMPEITNQLWLWIDLTFGLLLVGVIEETIFRGYLFTFLSRYTRSAAIIVAISAIAFGAIHWSGGLQSILVTSVIGAIFMALYLRTHSLGPLILAHFVVNFIDAANVIPKWYFSFVFG